MSALTMMITIFAMGLLYGPLFSFFEKRFPKEWVSLFWGLISAMVFYMAMPDGIQIETREIYLGGLIDIPVKLLISFPLATLAVFVYLMGCWALSGYSLPGKIKALVYSGLNVSVITLFLIEDLMVKVIILEIIAILASASYFFNKYDNEKRFSLVTNSFSLGLVLLLFVMELAGQIENNRILFNTAFFLYIIFRSGLLREFLISPSEDGENNAGIVEQCISTIMLTSVLNVFINGLGWEDVYFRKFAFIFLVSYAGIIYFVLNRTSSSKFLRVSQLKYFVLILALMNNSTDMNQHLAFIQLLIFFFVWEIFSTLTIKSNALSRFKWLIITLLVGPIPVLPLQNTMIKNTKELFSGDMVVGIVASIVVLLFLSLIPAGMFIQDEEATS